MKPIEFDRWKPSGDDPRRVVYDGQRTGLEVFKELRQRLDNMGCLPDEYFLLDTAWAQGREIPKGADIFCTTDYGASEGVYLDVYLKWHESGKPVTKSFITGKTPGETGADLDKMFLISSAITKAFHGEGCSFGPRQSSPEILSVSPQEKAALIDALALRREQLLDSVMQTERLLRRMTGSITAYMDAVGERPLKISDYDKAVLAIRDGEVDKLKELLPRVDEHKSELLVEAAGRAGATGEKMTQAILEHGSTFPEKDYQLACKKAIDMSSLPRVSSLLEQAEQRVENLSATFHGEVIQYASQSQKHMVRPLVKQCGTDQIAAAPPNLLWQAVASEDIRTACILTEKGIDGNEYASEIFRFCAQHNESWFSDMLLERGMKVKPENFEALQTCIECEQLDTAKTLLDHGMNLDNYQEWAANKEIDFKASETFQALAEHWSEMQNFTQANDAPQMTMM